MYVCIYLKFSNIFSGDLSHMYIYSMYVCTFAAMQKQGVEIPYNNIIKS